MIVFEMVWRDGNEIRSRTIDPSEYYGRDPMQATEPVPSAVDFRKRLDGVWEMPEA